MSNLLRVLVVDDSPSNRQRITTMVEGAGIGQVVAVARDGAEALSRVQQFHPDVITLDLEMPRMDGFAFLRVLMSTSPTPVVIVSSHSQKENVFRALELGAVDFVPKGELGIDDTFRQLLVEKLSAVRAVRTPSLSLIPDSRPARVDKARVVAPPRPVRLAVVIGASTGGPTALTEILANLQPNSNYGILIAQHMPAKFTRTFAQRLNRYSLFDVQEATNDQVFGPGMALICPGDFCMELHRDVAGGLRVRIAPPEPNERYVPSVSRLFKSVARTLGTRCVGVVLTGMGDDGADGVRAIDHSGGVVLAEEESSSVVYGMPRAAALAVPHCHQAPLSQMANRIAHIVEELLPDSRRVTS
jgi:two-component system, chemotaxis family, protein-glutamate methylesterase/glutaminase